MDAWIAITLAAAFLQNLRSLLQRSLKARLSDIGATFVRFGFGLPVGVALLVVLLAVTGEAMPGWSAAAFGWVALGGATQIGAQALLLALFSHRNFMVGTAYSRTEPAQAALFALLLTGERAGVATLVAIALAVAGVMLLSIARTALSAAALWQNIGSRVTLTGLASGALFGVAAVSYRAASLALDGGSAPVRGATVLVATLTMQTVVLLVWLAWRDRAQFAAIAAAWRPSALTGLVGALASFGWFTAMTLQQAAVVKALAQVEMLFALATAVLVFREHVNAREIAGAALIVAGIVGLLIWR